MKKAILLTSIVVVLASLNIGCATGPRIVAKNEAYTKYWQKTGESYQLGGDGTVTQASSRKSPAYYQNGILVNRSGESVSFSITGSKSVFYDVPGTSLEIQLAPGNYRVRIFKSGNSYPYKRFDDFIVDSERGDSVHNGVAYDFFVIAP